MKKNPTLKDVARVADVSTATVARVLHQKGYVAEETRQRVNTAIEQTGYRMNILAQSLRRRRTLTIGHLLTSILPNPFYAGVELGVEQEAIQNGYSVLIWNVYEDAQREKLGVETFIKRQVDAIIFTTPISAENVRMCVDSGIPVVQVERPTAVPTHTVWVDNYTGSANATQHLIDLGHRRIAFLGGDPDAYRFRNNIIEEERLAGYVDTLKRHEIPVMKEWILFGNYYSLEDGYRFDRCLLEKEPRITAIFATCDILAAGVLQVIYQLGMRVPQDISIVGFDNTYAPYLSPPLTTVEQPMLEMGRMAVKIVVDQFANRSESPEFRSEHLSTRLAVRSSTGPPLSING